MEGGVVNLMPHLYGELAKTEQGFSILQQDRHFVKTMKSLKRGDEVNIKQRASLWAAAHVGASVLGLRYLIENDIMDPLLDLTVTSSSLSTRGTCLMMLGLIGSTPEGREEMLRSGWTQPHAEVYRLVAVPNEATCRLLMQVPQPVYTGGSWTPNFMDPELISRVVKSAREERVASARSVRTDAAKGETEPLERSNGDIPVVEDLGSSSSNNNSSNSNSNSSSSRSGAGRAVGRGNGRGKPSAAVLRQQAAPSDEAPAPPGRRAVSPRATSPRSTSPRGSGRGGGVPRVPTDRKAPLPGGGNTVSPRVSPRPPQKQLPQIKVPPLTKLQDAIEKSEFDPNPLKESFAEEKKTILKLIVDMTSHITTEKALRALKKLRIGTPELFLDPECFLAALRLMEMYRFKLMIRRFIYELFGECIITQEQFKGIWDQDVDASRSSPRGVSPRRVGLKKELKKKAVLEESDEEDQEEPETEWE
jgi:hypothetical protein